MILAVDDPNCRSVSIAPSAPGPNAWGFAAVGLVGLSAALKDAKIGHRASMNVALERGGSRLPSKQDVPWYKLAIIYQAHVRTFYDSNGDGVGDFQGLDQKLDYLQELGINTIWLMPFFPSPLRDDGYDISDYYSVHSSYGTLEDFRTFLKSAHARQIRVIIEMVANHTSDQHPWFQQSRSSRENPLRDWYVWSDSCRTGRGTRFRNLIIGIVSSATSPTSIMTIPPSGKRCGTS
jgi:hypothetical protein